MSVSSVPAGPVAGQRFDEELPPQPRSPRDGPLQWRFARRPWWLLSHVFVVAMAILMVVLGQWQLDRLDQRRALNAAVETRALLEPVSLRQALTAAEPDYVAVSQSGRYVESEVVRVANRSQGGLAGDWSVAIFETTEGDLVLVNRGFVRLGHDAAPVELGAATITGWVRASHRKEGMLGGTDDGTSFRVPRLDVDAIAGRLAPGDAERLVPLWIQLAPSDVDFVAAAAVDPTAPLVPEPVPLPDRGEGNHLSYALQWFAFATMTLVVYGLILRRRASEPGT